jgi:curved DNA-binding protein
MNDSPNFVDHYGVLQVSPDCDAKILRAAYHHLAKKYHPDRSGTADPGKFNAVIEAYRVLRNAERRGEYDLSYPHLAGRRSSRPQASEDVWLEKDSAIDDSDDQARLLLYLYKKRRDDAQNAGVIGYHLQEMLNCSEERFQFHKWYLKEKGFIATSEQGTLAITIQGVDHVISMSRTTKAEKLLLEQLGRAQE